jgi:enterochelin esterase-like enzyme
MGASTFLIAAVLAQATSDGDPQRCASETAPIDQPCTLPLQVSPAAAEALLIHSESASWLLGDRLTLVARPSADSYGILCCAIQAPVEPLGAGGLVGVTIRVPRVEEALIDVGFPRRGSPPFPVIRGPNAPPEAHQAAPLRGTIRWVDLDSAVLGERRSLPVYVPPDVDPDARLPVIYLADATTQAYAPILEAAVAEGRARPAIIVGIPSGLGEATGCVRSVSACTRRNLEYLPHASATGAGADSPFGRHLRFVADEVVPFVERTYSASPRREDRIVAGHSSGGAWAFSAAARRPETFGAVIAFSASGPESADDASLLGRARIYAGGGTFEPYYLAATQRRAELARSAGAQVRFREIVSGHSIAMWSILFADAAAWLLPPR